ncbi:hypothetical protein MBANPS3_011850 [Mucor bainieri]
MLNQLPNEIVIHVLLYLSKSDLLECITVTRSVFGLVIPILYRHVSSTDPSRVSPGVRYLCSNPAVAQYVHSLHLRVERGCQDVEKLPLLPHVLTNLRELHINADYELTAVNTNTAPECQRTLQCLTVRERGISFAAGLLQSGTFTSLTCLHISFLQKFWPGENVILTSSGQPSQGMMDMGRKFIPCLLHVPELTVLNVSYPKFDLNDMEQLHINSPNLTELTLINGCFPANMARLTTANSDARPVTKLKLLHLTLRPDSRKMSRQNKLEFTLTRWLMFIGRKYPQLKGLTMEITDGDGNEQNLAECIQRNIFRAAKDQMQQIISKLDGVEKIETQLFPFTQANVELCNKHQLQMVKLFDYEIDIETQMRNLHNSKQKESIHSVSLAANSVDDHADVDLLHHVFTKYQMDHITKIDIKSVLVDSLSGFSYKFSLHLLRYVPSLEVLAINNLQITDRKVLVLEANRLKSLHIYRFYIFQNWKASNRYLQAVLHASPLLETFSTTLKIDYRSNRQYHFLLDMTGNKHLKSVCLAYFDQDTCLLLEHDPKRTEKYWKTLTTSIPKPSHFSTYSFIDLRWNDTTRVDAYPVPPPGYH